MNGYKKTFHFPEVRVVEASAGSGKTYALAKRYVQLLLNPALHLEQVPMRNILAITFTNKAAFEMKSRILEFLKKLALGQISQEEAETILAPIGVSTDVARQKAFMVMEKLILNYNFFQVQTIDSFINALLSGCAFKIDLTANFKIKTNSLEYLEYSLAQLIDQASNDKKLLKMFDYFLHNYLYLENRTGWFPREDILSIVFDLFQQNNIYGHKYEPSQNAPDDLIRKKKSLLEDMKKLRDILPDGTNAAFARTLQNFLLKHPNSFDVDSISDYFAREEIPVRKNSEVSKEVDRLWSKIQKNIQCLCEEEAFALFNPYIHIFEEVIKAFRDLSTKDDVLFLEELNKRAGLLFDEDYVTVEELYYRLATRFHHYLIDEFQDTSRLQWHNVEKMAEEALSTGGSLFYVGDRKQAIYGFRGGDVGLFDEIQGEFRPFNVQIENLSKNWRSQKAIVEFNNSIFSPDNLKRFILSKEVFEADKKKKNMVIFNDEDYKELDGIFGTSQQTFKEDNNEGYVHVEHVDIDKKEDRDEYLRGRILKLINELRLRFSFRDIAILTRSNAQVEQLTGWLLEEGIQVESERTSNIQENTLIAEMVSFLQFLNSPIDNIAFAGFILGDLFSKAVGLSKEELQDFVFGLRQRLKDEKDFYIYTEFRKKYPRVWKEYVEEFFSNVGLYPLYEMVVSVYYRWGCLQHFETNQGFLMHFLAIVKKQEDDHSDLSSFLEYFDNIKGEDLFVNVMDSDAIKILTIHKAKGLEFPVVILPFLGMDIQVGAQGSDNKQSYILKKSDESIELIRLKNKYLNFSENLYGIYAEEYRKALFAELNNVYVALTRPRNELYAFIPKKVKAGFNFAKFLIPEEMCESGRAVSYKLPGHKEREFLKLPCSQYYDWINFLKEEFQDYNQIRNREHRVKGEIAHYMLSFIDNLAVNKKDALIKEAIRQAELRFTHIKDFAPYVSLLEKVLDAENLKQFFHVKGGEVFMEKDIINRFGHTKRLDRLVVKKDEVCIVDYKSSKDPNARYEEQVKEYMELTKDIYPKREVRGFLVYLDKLNFEEVK